MLKVNSNISKMPSSYLFSEIASRVAKYTENHPNAEIIRLGIGDVTRPIGKSVVNALQKASEEMGNANTFRGYPPERGYDFLINAIIKNDYEKYGVKLSPEEVFISDGAKSDCANIQELFSPTEKVAVCDPVYPVYVDSNAMCGRAGRFANGIWDKLLYMPCTIENDFVPDVPDIHVDVIYLCSPNNPTGKALSKQELKNFVDYAIKHGSVIVYDAAYKDYIQENDVPHSIYEIEGAKTCAIECCSYSKGAGFTGVRCSYTIVPKDLHAMDDKTNLVSLRDMWARRQASKFNGVSYIIQKAAEATYSSEGRQECLENVRYYLQNGEIMLNELKKLGYDAFGGKNSPYIWLKTPDNISGWDFFDMLLKKANIVGTPGEGFGPSGAGYFRLTAFNTVENTQKAMERIAKL